MKLACADPTLWPRRIDSAGVSLAHTIAAKPFELCRFVFMDALSSLLLGVPPLVEYDTSSPTFETDPTHPLEWVHGCPAALIVAIVKINIWRSQGHSNLNADKAKEIETDIQGWYPKCDYGKLDNSWQLVARLAIQEGWRHAALIYLHMVSSIGCSSFWALILFVGNVPLFQRRPTCPKICTADDSASGNHPNRCGPGRTSLHSSPCGESTKYLGSHRNLTFPITSTGCYMRSRGKTERPLKEGFGSMRRKQSVGFQGEWLYFGSRKALARARGEWGYDYLGGLCTFETRATSFRYLEHLSPGGRLIYFGL